MSKIIEKLKQELFDCEIPEDNKKILENFEGFVAPDSISPIRFGLPVYSEQMKLF